MSNTYKGFDSWEQLIAHVKAGAWTFYHAPMDLRPVRVKAKTHGEGLTIRVIPYGAADPFTADRGHFDRFKRLGGTPIVEVRA